MPGRRSGTRAPGPRTTRPWPGPRLLLDAAAAAGVRRIVHVGITQPSADTRLTYFRGKAQVEAHLRGTRLSHAILRPSCFFGGADILLNNIAYGVRRCPFFPLPGPPDYRIRPIHVRDMAGAMCDYGAGTENVVRDACGPEQYGFADLVARMGPWLGVGPCRPLPLPRAVCRGLYGAAGLVLRDTILSRDELIGLSAGLLGSDEEPLGTTRLSEWIKANRGTLGRRFRPEPKR